MDQSRFCQRRNKMNCMLRLISAKEQRTKCEREGEGKKEMEKEQKKTTHN